MLARSIVLLAVAVLWAVVATPAVAQSVNVDPLDGDQEETFVFSGSGFAPGDSVTMHFTSPDGTPYILLADDGGELLLTVAEDGTFAISLVPVELFVGAPAGEWQAEFCPSSGEFCLAGTFSIRVD